MNLPTVIPHDFSGHHSGAYWYNEQQREHHRRIRSNEVEIQNQRSLLEI